LALMLRVVFGAKTMMANSLVSTYFFGDRYKLVRPFCKQHPKENSNRQDEFSTPPAQVLFTMAVTCHETFLTATSPKNNIYWNAQLCPLFYVPRLPSLLFLEHPFPPPKIG